MTGDQEPRVVFATEATDYGPPGEHFAGGDLSIY